MKVNFYIFKVYFNYLSNFIDLSGLDISYHGLHGCQYIDCMQSFDILKNTLSIRNVHKSSPIDRVHKKYHYIPIIATRL